MSQAPRLTPYKWRNQVLEVRDLLYKGSPADQLRALEIVARWQSRGKLPHGIDATALLVATRLQDQRQSPGLKAQDSMLLRSAYSLAIVRFVNGILDPFQQGAYAIALVNLAKNIGLPASFVEARHWATHDELPSLAAMRRMCLLALQWLFDNFWVPFETDECVPDDTFAVFGGVSRPLQSVVAAEARSLIRNYKSAQRLGGTADIIKTVLDLSLFANDTSNCGALVKFLVHEKVLLRKTPTEFYKPLFDAFPEPFLMRLVTALVVKLSTNALTETQSAMVNQWLEVAVPKVLNGRFPWHVAVTYKTKADVVTTLQNLTSLLSQKGPTHRLLQALIKGRKKAPALPPLLDELLASPRDESSAEPGEPPSKRLKPSALPRLLHTVFETCPNWKPTPFGTYPVS